MTDRDALTQSRRIIVKLGSKVIAEHDNIITDICEQIVQASTNSPRDFIIVSSGAIALGWKKLGYEARPTQMPKLQAAAAAGQGILVQRYAEALAPSGRAAAQVLLTHSDLASRRRLTNAQQALNALLDAHAVPIINENDTVSTDEVAFGDNDQLSSMVVPLVGADLLLLLSDVPGVLDDAGERIPLLTEGSNIGTRKRDRNSAGSGGIESKLSAAKKAAHSGAHVVIGPATSPDIIGKVLAGADVGTLIKPNVTTLRAREHWIAYTLKPRGVILVNEGAVEALTSRNSSLLPVGVLGIRGTFSRGDAVRLVGPNGEVARGLTRLGALEVARAAGKTSTELTTQLGELDPVVVHRNDLVLSK